MDNSRESTNTVVRLKGHIDPSFEKLECMVDYCPDDLWNEINGGFPFWQQVYHVLYWNHRWFREDYNISFQQEDFGKSISPHLDDKTTGYLTKDELMSYTRKVKERIAGYFKALDDRKLFEPVRVGAELTYFDVILNQIRHIQYHVGHCNSILRDKGVKAVDWLAYGEKRQS